MGRIRPLIIHKSEWMRLQSQANPAQEPEPPRCKVDIEALNEKSRQWKLTWPDTEEGQVHIAGLKVKEKEAKKLAEIEAFKNRPKYDNSAVIKKARDMIFERRNYGRQLISAIAESKALEEREEQIKFKKQIEEEAKRIEESQPQVQNIMYAEFDKGNASKRLSTQRMIENAHFNKAIAKMKAEDASKAARIEEMHRKEDMEIMEKIRQLEILERNGKIGLDEEDVKKYEAENKLVKERRAKREILDQDLADIWKKYYEKVRCKEEQILQQIHREKHNSERFKGAYEMVLQLQNEENKKYSNFIEKGVIDCKKRLEKREKEEEQHKERLQQLKIAQAPSYKAGGEKQADRDCKCYCDRQTILRRSRLDKKEKTTLKESKPSFLQPYKRVRAHIAGGWSGADAERAQFAAAAGAARAECRYKQPITRVVQEYCKHNVIKDLPITN